MDPKEEDLLINLASMSRKCWLTFTTFKTRWYDPKSEICFTYTRILLFLRNILQKSSKNYETIARFSLLCSHWKVQSAKPSQLAQNNCNLLWQILVALTKLLVGQNWHDPKWLYSDWEYLRSNWNFAVGFEHSQHTNIWLNDVWNIPGLMKWIQTKWLFQNICSQFDLTQTQSTLSDLSAWLRVSLEVAPSSSSSHLLWYSADGSKCINFSVEKFSFGSPNFTFHLE